MGGVVIQFAEICLVGAIVENRSVCSFEGFGIVIVCGFEIPGNADWNNGELKSSLAQGSHLILVDIPFFPLHI